MQLFHTREEARTAEFLQTEGAGAHCAASFVGSNRMMGTVSSQMNLATGCSCERVRYRNGLSTDVNHGARWLQETGLADMVSCLFPLHSTRNVRR